MQLPLCFRDTLASGVALGAIAVAEWASALRPRTPASGADYPHSPDISLFFDVCQALAPPGHISSAAVARRLYCLDDFAAYGIWCIHLPLLGVLRHLEKRPGLSAHPSRFSGRGALCAVVVALRRCNRGVSSVSLAPAVSDVSTSRPLTSSVPTF